jgi:hypothetical protein
VADEAVADETVADQAVAAAEDGGPTVDHDPGTTAAQPEHRLGDRDTIL